MSFILSYFFPDLEPLCFSTSSSNCSLGISYFLEEISSLSHSIIFLYFFSLITEEGFLISLLFFGTLHSDAYMFPFLFCFCLPFFSQLFVRPPQTAILLFWISFSWGWSFIKFVCVCVCARACVCVCACVHVLNTRCSSECSVVWVSGKLRMSHLKNTSGVRIQKYIFT